VTASTWHPGTLPVVGNVRTILETVRRGIEGPDGPAIAWTLRGYRPAQLSGDLIAGLTVAALIVPLSIGYAGVAGLPPEVGLYASLAPLVLYAVFGSARRLIVGPDASTAALIAATIVPLAAASDDRVRLASVLALLVAAVFVAMRLGRMGFLADFLSRPILVGYMMGVGITVAVGQVEKVLGGPAIAEALAVLDRIDWSTADLEAVAAAVSIAVTGSGADLASLIIGGGVIAAMLIGRRLVPRVPVALLSMIVALIASAVLDLQSRGVQVLGPVPAGLPPLGVPAATPSELVALLPGALGLAILSFADTTVTGRSFAARHGERTDANRELVALAASDAAGALTSGYPISSSPSRTSAAEEAGSSSQMTGLIAAAAVAVVLVLFTGPLAFLPMPALGGVILVSVLGLIDAGQVRSIWRLKRSEGLIAIIAMAGVIFYGTLVGVGIAVLLAALNIVRRAAWPQIVEEGRLSDGTWRDLARRGDGQRVNGVITIRFGGPLFFANATALQARIRELVAARPDVQVVILDLGATADVDLTAGGAIRDLADELARAGRRLAVAQPLGVVRDELRAYGLADLMAPTSGTHGSVDAAILGLGLDPSIQVSDATIAAPSEPTAAVPTAPSVPTQVSPASGGGDRVAVPVIGGGIALVVGAVVLASALGAWGGGVAPGPAAIPNLIGLPLDRATTAAGDAGFVLSPPVYVQREDRPEGTVVAQAPPAGTVADRGSMIQPVVSTARELVDVPDVIGQTEAQAIATLTGAGLTVRRDGTVSDDAIPVGSIVTTAPAAGAGVASGTVVAYVVSSGPPTDAPSATPSPTPRPTVPSPTPPSPPAPTPASSPGATDPAIPATTPVPTPGGDASPVPPVSSP
jgi:sulfate permease, SulP family